MTDLYPNLEITPEPEPILSPPVYPTATPTPTPYVPPVETPISTLPAEPPVVSEPKSIPETPSSSTLPIYVPKSRSSLGPILLGFFLVIFLAGVIGVVYFQTKFTESTPSPTPTPSAMPTTAPSIEPTMAPSSTPKATKKPVSAIVPIASPKPTAVPQPTLDIRFGNPSVNVKQTIDEGAGDGRVINREYTSIQTGQFDEVKSVWSPRVTVCYHIVSNEEVVGKNIKFIFTLDDKVEVENDLSQYDKLEAGRLYDWCHDVTSNIGKHTAKLAINPSASIKELNYTNNLARLDWENLADKIAPNFTLIGPINEGVSGTCLFPQYVSDNVNSYSELKIEQKVDNADWSKFDGNRYCFVGTSGTMHTYLLKITDSRGNINEQNRTFNLY